MTVREAKLQQIVRDCLPPCLRLDSLELTHGTLIAGQTPRPKVVIYATEVRAEGAEPDPGWFLELDLRVADLLGHDDFYLAILDAPPRM
jgi:hypothetical protein